MIAFVLLRVFLILLLVAANAFFAAAEFALVSIRDTRIQQLIEARRIGARIVQKLHRNLDEVVNGVQLGITIVSLTLGWVGEPLLAKMMMGPVSDFPHAAVYAHGIAIVIAFSLITCLHVILGELVPKSLALQRAEQVALAVAAPMDVFLTLTRPLLFMMSRAAGPCSGFSARARFGRDPSVPRRTEADCDRQPPVRTDSTFPGRDDSQRTGTRKRHGAGSHGSAPGHLFTAGRSDP